MKTLTDGAATLRARCDADTRESGAVELASLGAVSIKGDASATALRVVHDIDAIEPGCSMIARAESKAIGTFL